MKMLGEKSGREENGETLGKLTDYMYLTMAGNWLQPTRAKQTVNSTSTRVSTKQANFRVSVMTLKRNKGETCYEKPISAEYTYEVFLKAVWSKFVLTSSSPVR